MKRFSLAAATLLAATTLLHSATGRSQDEPIKLRGELVVLDVQVLHKKTSLVIGDLKREDFILVEDGVKQHISHFSRDKLPLSVIILMDVSGSVAPNASSYKRLLNGAYEALKLLKPEDEVALMQFAERPDLVQGFTRDRDLAISALGRLDGRGQYGTHVDEGILRAADYMHKAANPDSRRAIITVTDDVTVGIKDRAYVVPTTIAEGQALRELYESGSVVCALIYGSGEDRPQSREEIQSTEPIISDPSSSPGIPRQKFGVAKRMAEATGGITITTTKENVPTRLSDVIERLRQRYAIGYSSSNSGRDGRFRKIKLMVTPEIEKREGGVAVMTRKGYYAK